MDSEPFSFPVWVYINRVDDPTAEGYPFFLMIRGGHDSPVPASVPVFSSEQRARDVGDEGHPFVIVKMDKKGFYEALGRCRYVEDVVFDMGTPDAEIYRVEELLTKFVD